MITVFTKTDKTYGGSDYVEVNYENKTYRTANTRSHSGFIIGNKHYVEVATKKELKNIINDIEKYNFKEVI